jgi:hypothetical protein
MVDHKLLLDIVAVLFCFRRPPPCDAFCRASRKRGYPLDEAPPPEIATGSLGLPEAGFAQALIGGSGPNLSVEFHPAAARFPSRPIEPGLLQLVERAPAIDRGCAVEYFPANMT